MATLLLLKTRLGHQLEDPIRRVVLEPRLGVKHSLQAMVSAVLSNVEIQKKQAAARFQHSPDFAQSADFLPGFQVMKHKG